MSAQPGVVEHAPDDRRVLLAVAAFPRRGVRDTSHVERVLLGLCAGQRSSGILVQLSGQLHQGHQQG